MQAPDFLIFQVNSVDDTYLDDYTNYNIQQTINKTNKQTINSKLTHMDRKVKNQTKPEHERQIEFKRTKEQGKLPQGYEIKTEPKLGLGFDHFEVEWTLIEVFSTENTSVKVY